MPHRRTFLATAGAGLVAAASRAAGQWRPSPRYPDPAVQTLDPRFGRYALSLAKVERLATGFRWCEGPVWFGDGRYLLFSDIPGDRILRWDETTGAVSVFREPSGNANGNARDRQGRLITCEHDNRRVTRTEYDGSLTVIADAFEGRPLNSPNDLVCRSDGSIWFTDPPFGILGFYEGHPAPQELPTNVYRWDPGRRSLSVVAGDLVRPNGLAFSPDESRLYVVEAGVSPRRIHAYAVEGDALGERRTVVEAGAGTPDGLRVDEDGNLWVGWGMGESSDGVAVFDAEGAPLGHVALPERCANLCFGGRHRNRLFMCGSTSLYALYVNTRGAVTS